MIHTGQCGIGVATGVGHIIIGNLVLNINSSINGSGNTAIYVWNQYSGDCGSIIVSHNVAYLNRPDGYVSSFWDGGNCIPLNVTNNIWGSDSLNYLTPQQDKLPTPLVPPIPYECLVLSSWSNNGVYSSCYSSVSTTTSSESTTGSQESSSIKVIHCSFLIVLVFVINLI